MHITRAHTCARYACKRRELELIIPLLALVTISVVIVSSFILATHNKSELQGIRQLPSPFLRPAAEDSGGSDTAGIVANGEISISHY